ncbi:hypothetical protein [Lysinibacillus fusiformis]|uniref:hypothetical protein n=1 Tax=Lysinibacillus fusiformis TaxID=28031 RepID=UPI00263B8B7A|nr:hypothetical protein [Lysinibacillus fusiformis]MDC6267336.1 hypothetical protein [Lysinibacillus sphaericus]MDN4968230.1 hypothetical protein [Lysinibacillus fusiformis]MDN4968404.1 hypothetical protein [Lysinibacillus fusiformis]
MKEIKTVELYESESVDSALLLIISKLSITQPEESLRLLAMCAKDDVPKKSVLKYAIGIVENGKYLS